MAGKYYVNKRTRGIVGDLQTVRDVRLFYPELEAGTRRGKNDKKPRFRWQLERARAVYRRYGKTLRNVSGRQYTTDNVRPKLGDYPRTRWNGNAFEMCRRGWTV